MERYSQLFALHGISVDMLSLLQERQLEEMVSNSTHTHTHTHTTLNMRYAKYLLFLMIHVIS